MVDMGKKLRELRQERQWTQGQVAERLGVTVSVVSAYENGIRYPSYENLVKLAGTFGVTADYLLGISGRRSSDSRHLVSLDGLTPSKISLVISLIDALKE